MSPPLLPPEPELVAQVRQLERRFEMLETEVYVSLRDLHRKVDTNHLIMLDGIGQLARLLGGKLEPLDPKKVIP